MESNPIIDQLPDHLKQYIKPQNYESYTAINQSVWKYVMRRNISFLKKHAHDFYITGLKKACISIVSKVTDVGSSLITRTSLRLVLYCKSCFKVLMTFISNIVSEYINCFSQAREVD